MSDTIEQNPPSIESRLEALLLVASDPMTAAQFAEVMGEKTQDVDIGLQNLAASYAMGRGFALQWHRGRVQLTTAPVFASLVERFLGLEVTTRLSRAGLETLAIIAYRQPVTRPGIDSIRGVNSDGVLRSLLNKGLVQEVGRAEGPGRPILYATSSSFLQHFGLGSVEELPPFVVDEVEGEPEGKRLLKD